MKYGIRARRVLLAFRRFPREESLRSLAHCTQMRIHPAEEVGEQSVPLQPERCVTVRNSQDRISRVFVRDDRVLVEPSQFPARARSVDVLEQLRAELFLLFLAFGQNLVSRKGGPGEVEVAGLDGKIEPQEERWNSRWELEHRAKLVSIADTNFAPMDSPVFTFSPQLSAAINQELELLNLESLPPEEATLVAVMHVLARPNPPIDRDNPADMLAWAYAAEEARAVDN